MNPLSLIKAIASPVLKIIDDIVPDKDLANQLKTQVSQSLLELDGELLKAQSSIISIEAKGSILQRNWRPALMVWFAFLIGMHWFGFTPSGMPESVVNSLLDIIMVGVGGYVVGRSGEKIAASLSKKS